MKRIKLRQHKYLTLYKIQTDSGSHSGFEIARPLRGNRIPFSKTFTPDQEQLAHHLFNTLAILMDLYGPQLTPKFRRLTLTGCGFCKPRSRVVE